MFIAYSIKMLALYFFTSVMFMARYCCGIFFGGSSWTFPELLVRTVYFACRWKTVASPVALPRNFLCVCLVEIPKHPHGEFIVPLISGND